MKINLKGGAQITQQKGRHTLTKTIGKRTKTIDRKRISGKSDRNYRKLFRESPSNNSKERQVNQNTNEVTKKRKAQMPHMEELISRNSRKTLEREDGEILATLITLTDKLNWTKRQEIYVYLPLRVENSLATSVSRKDFVVWQLS